MALRTTFRSGEGTLELINAMDLGESSDPHRLGENAPHALLREVYCASGWVRVEMIYRPRPEYGLVVPVFSRVPSAVVATAGSGRFTLEAGDHVYFALHRTGLGETLPPPSSQGEIEAALATTIAGWRHWSSVHQNYNGAWRDFVHHSARVLQALSYQPTGADSSLSR